VCLQKQENGVRLKTQYESVGRGWALFFDTFDGLIIIDVYLITQLLSVTNN